MLHSGAEDQAKVRLGLFGCPMVSLFVGDVQPQRDPALTKAVFLALFLKAFHGS